MSMDAKSLCGLNLRRLRKQAGITPVELAQAADLSVATLLAIEEGVSDIGIDELDRLVHQLGIPLRDLFADKASEEQSLPQRRIGRGSR